MTDPNSKYAISVIIPTYNRSELLRYSLESLVRQTIPADCYEVIVADDGSTDDTREMVQSFSSRMNLKFVFQEDKGYRPGSARNKGVSVAEGKICMFIDSGVLLNNNCLEEHLRFYDKHARRVAVIGYVYGIERSKESEKKLMEIIDPLKAHDSILKLSGHEIFSDIREEHYLTYNYRIDHLPAPWFYFWTCHVSILKEELIEVGLFEEVYDGRWGVEDNDLAYRLCEYGVKIHLLRNAEAIHYPHEKDKQKRRIEGYVNCEYFHNKYQTLETKLFLDIFLNTGKLIDINAISLQMQAANAGTTPVAQDFAYSNPVPAFPGK
jgi:glycosyltransferase involved in cell wall biosynthesis